VAPLQKNILRVHEYLEIYWTHAIQDKVLRFLFVLLVNNLNIRGGGETGSLITKLATRLHKNLAWLQLTLYINERKPRLVQINF
jgi:hypothetical protein